MKKQWNTLFSNSRQWAKSTHMALFCLGLALFSNPIYAGSCDTLNENTCSVLKNFKIADSEGELNFQHLCSSLDKNDGFSYSAYAFFETTDEHKKYKALVLGELDVGWISSTDPVTNVIGFNLQLEKLRVQNLDKWAGAPFSIALEIKNKRTKQVVTGPLSNTYFYSYQGSGYPVDKKYRLSDKGHLDWVKLIEPEEVKKDTQTEAGTCMDCEKGPIEAPKRNEYKGSEFIKIDKKHLKNLEDPHTLYVVFRNKNTGEKITLKGPDINNLEDIFKNKFSRPKALTWEFLNPWQEGGLWDFLRDTFQYQDCIYLRKKAKKDFDQRF